MDQENLKTTTHHSPSGKYSLELTPIPNGKGYWNYIKAVVKLRDRVLFELERNYSSFPFLWIEDHPSVRHNSGQNSGGCDSGHDFLVCGENYQGQTVLDLCCLEKYDNMSPGAEEGFGFCWASYEFDRENQVLLVEGCHWACPYEFRFFDFSDPREGWPELKADSCIDDDFRKPEIRKDGTIIVYETRDLDYDDDDEDSEEDEENRTAVAIKEFKINREERQLTLVKEWVDPEEQKRREERARLRKEWEAARQHYRKTNPLYLRIRERIEAEEQFITADSWEGWGVCYLGWCPEFHEEDRRVSRRIANKQQVGSDHITMDLEWGREKAPVKLVVYRNGSKYETKWFDHSVEGVDAALDHASEILLPPPTIFDRMKSSILRKL